ncbi:MAG: DHHA1 domain-containing protein [Acidobacteriia bacterium]|nr:DHHA1 domain-containing protein [Terriglobia bacterium]
MPTERLYYEDSFLCSFEASVVSMNPVGSVYHVRLDRTAFYPTGGGQPHDTGVIDAIRVVDVVEQEDSGEVVHVTEGPVSSNQVHGEIDWPRRQDHMQQHSGQHLLSAAFVHLCDAPTVGFHLGMETSTIDLKTDRLIPDLLESVIHAANAVVFEDRPVKILNVTREEAAARHLRKESGREGILRLIEVPDFDCTPCGGTHVTRTGQVGLILPRKVERYKQGWRVEFVCGERASKWATKDFEALSRVSKLLSSPFDPIPELIKKQLEENKTLRRERLKLLDDVAFFRSQELFRESKVVGRLHLLCRAIEDQDMEWAKLLARHFASQSNAVGVLVIPGDKCQVIISTSADSGVDANQLLKTCAQKFPLRGGGSKNMAQGLMEDKNAIRNLFEFVEQECSSK